MTKDINESSKEVSESLKMVIDLTSRIDERIKVLIEGNADTKEKIEKLAIQYNEASTRISLLESKNTNLEINELKSNIKGIDLQIDNINYKLIDIEKDLKSHSYKWSSLIDFIFKIGVTIMGGLILWKLGVK